jgi:hypothetical protein
MLVVLTLSIWSRWMVGEAKSGKKATHNALPFCPLVSAKYQLVTEMAFLPRDLEAGFGIFS